MAKTKEYQEKDSGKRIGFIDEIRGISIILMIAYHTGYDLVAIYNVDMPFFFTPQMNLLRDIFAGVFIFISGSACRLSRNNLKRGVFCLLAGVALSVVTYFISPENFILFGILHFLGISMILFWLMQKFLDKIRFPIIGITLFGLLFVITQSIQTGTLSLGTVFSISLPTELYQNDWLFAFGIHSSSFFSSDYFPLIPWFFLFLVGSYFGVYLKSHRLPKFFYKTHVPFFAYVGRHTLIVYLAHQPIVYATLYLVFNYIIK